MKKTNTQHLELTPKNIEMIKEACKECGGISATFLMRKFKLTFQEASRDVEIILNSIPVQVDENAFEQSKEIDNIKTSLLKLQERLVVMENEFVRVFATKTFK